MSHNAYNNNKMKHFLGCPGWRTNSKFMDYQLNSCGWSKIPDIKIHAIDPYHTAEGPPSSDVLAIMPDEKFYQWWYVKEDDSCEGFDDSFRYIMSYLDGPLTPQDVRNDGGFAGIVAFSQGVACATLTLHLIQQGILKQSNKLKIRGFISVCGVPARYNLMKSKYIDEILELINVEGKTFTVKDEHKMDIPSLHFIGKQDKLNIYSELETMFFKDPKIVYTDTNHKFSTKKLMDDPDALEKFLKRI